MNDALPMWTIYDHPRDYPYGFVIRKSFIWSMPWPNGKRVGAHCQAQGAIMYATLAQARNHCASLGGTPLARHPGEDPVIVETWI